MLFGIIFGCDVLFEDLLKIFFLYFVCIFFLYVDVICCYFGIFFFFGIWREGFVECYDFFIFSGVFIDG